ncbi:MAG: hypothetical protein ACFFAJ_14205 [Candidatus Hodarchaeota archaeon]
MAISSMFAFLRRIKDSLPGWKGYFIFIGVLIIWIFVILAVIVNLYNAQILTAFLMFFSGFVFSFILWLSLTIIDRIFPQIVRE